LDTAIGSVPRPVDRFEATDTDSRRFINTFRRAETLWVGNLFDFTEGSLPAGFILDPTATELPVQALAEVDGTKRFIESNLYFGLMGDHVVIMPSGSLRVADLQRHLNWLLRERTNTLPQEAHVVLMDESAPEVRANWNGVRAITFRSPLTPELLLEPESTDTAWLGRALQPLLRGLFSGDLTIGNLEASDAQSLERLSVTLQVKYKGRVEHVDTRLLDHLAAILPDEEANKYEFEVKGIGRVKGGQVKLAHKKSIQYGDSLPVFVNVAAKMHEWLYRLLEQGRIRD